MTYLIVIGIVIVIAVIWFLLVRMSYSNARNEENRLFNKYNRQVTANTGYDLPVHLARDMVNRKMEKFLGKDFHKPQARVKFLYVMVEASKIEAEKN
jgi:hypothetical protein